MADTARVVSSYADLLVLRHVWDGAARVASDYADVPQKAEMGEYETFFSNRKIREVLGFRENHDWRKYVKV